MEFHTAAARQNIEPHPLFQILQVDGMRRVFERQLSHDVVALIYGIITLIRGLGLFLFVVLFRSLHGGT